MSAAAAAALFEVDGDRFVPTELSRGPWDPDALHGGPVSALVMRAVEAAPSAEPMAVTRLTVELVRPVPMAPLAVRAEVVRPGRKVQLVEVTITAGESMVTRARAQRIRCVEVSFPDGVDADGGPPPLGPEHGTEPTAWNLVELPTFHSNGTELRFVKGGFDVPGPCTVWARLTVPLIEGEEPTGAQRAAAAADFANGVSAVLEPEDYLFLNPDLTVSLFRPPEGEWICLDAQTLLGPDGAGLSDSALYDRLGRVGRSNQCILVERRS